MDQSTPHTASQLLRDITPYVYGTTRLGDQNIPFEERVALARTAMDAGVWFHTSHTYGNALEVLRAAFDQDRARVPKLIVKLGWSNMPEFKDVLRRHLDALALDSLELGQLCLSGELGAQFASGGDCYAEFARMQADGLVKRFVVEVFPWSSGQALSALRGGYMRGIVDGFILYLNPLQRFASNELWDEIIRRGEPVIAMRTVAGGPVHKLRDVPGFAWKDYLRQRAAEVAPIFERSGVPGWTEFCIRFAHSFAVVRATVGSSGKAAHLQEFLAARDNIQPLPAEMVAEITRLHYRWSDELDMKAELWSM